VFTARVHGPCSRAVNTGRVDGCQKRRPWTRALCVQALSETCGRWTGCQLDVDVVVWTAERVAVAMRRRRLAIVLGLVTTLPLTTSQRVEVYRLNKCGRRWLTGARQVPSTTRVTTTSTTQQTLHAHQHQHQHQRGSEELTCNHWPLIASLHLEDFIIIMSFLLVLYGRWSSISFNSVFTFIMCITVLCTKPRVKTSFIHSFIQSIIITP